MSAAGAAAPLSYGEERNAFGYATARGLLAGLRAAAPAADPGKKNQEVVTQHFLGSSVFFGVD